MSTIKLLIPVGLFIKFLILLPTKCTRLYIINDVCIILVYTLHALNIIIGTYLHTKIYKKTDKYFNHILVICTF